MSETQAISKGDHYQMQTLFEGTISLREEMTAYETLCGMKDSTTKRVSDLFRLHGGLPSRIFDIIQKEDMFVSELRTSVERFLDQLSGFSVSVNGAFQYPTALRAASHPLELFYYRGQIELTEGPCVSIVGARKASQDGISRAKRLATEIVKAGYTVVSGLAHGIDTAAMTAAIESKGKTIGVIGTPITESYPKENRDLQELVAGKHLLISQVPFYRYKHQPFKSKKNYFPQRNETMSALSRATIIVEAGDTSGTLTQARAAIKQGRKLFILNSCFENPNITWPEKYEKKGAIRIRKTDDILEALKAD